MTEDSQILTQLRARADRRRAAEQDRATAQHETAQLLLEGRRHGLSYRRLARATGLSLSAIHTIVNRQEN